MRGSVHVGWQTAQPVPAGVRRADGRLLRQVRRTPGRGRIRPRRRRAVRHRISAHPRPVRRRVRQSITKSRRRVARHRRVRVNPPGPAAGLRRALQRPLLHVPQRTPAHRPQRLQRPRRHRRRGPSGRMDVQNRRKSLLVPDAGVRRDRVRRMHRRVRVRCPAQRHHQVEVPSRRARRLHRRHRQPHRQRHHPIHGGARRDVTRGVRQLRHQ